MTRGIFDLRTPQDLVNKLRHNYGRMRKQTADSYPAFDFFVTANHMVDWVSPGVKNDVFADFLQGKSAYEKDLLKTCRAIANGSKHFKLNKNTKHVGAAFDPHAFDNASFQVGALMIEPEGRAAAELGTEVEATIVAERLLQYWESYLR